MLRAIRDPQSVSRWSIMPKYDLTETQLPGLTEYLLSLEFKRHGAKVILKHDLLEGKAQ